MEATIDDIRHVNFLALLVSLADENGTLRGANKRMAEKLGVSESWVSQLRNRAAHSVSGAERAIGDETARKLEAAFGKPVGWMDSRHDEVPMQVGRAIAAGRRATILVGGRPVGREAVEEANREGRPPLYNPPFRMLHRSERGAGRMLQIDDEPTRESEESVAEGSTEALSMSLAAGEMWIPRHESVYPRMGSAGMDSSDEVVSLVRVSIEGMRRQLGPARITGLASLRLVTATGDSMAGTFNHGDLLVVDTGVQSVAHDGIYVLRDEETTRVKRVAVRGGGRWTILSDNPLYPPEPVEAKERAAFRVLGRVVFAWKGALT